MRVDKLRFFCMPNICQKTNNTKRNDCLNTSAKGLLSSFKEDRLVREEIIVCGHLFILLFDNTKD